MKIYYYFEDKRNPKDKGVINSIYGENIIFTSIEPIELLSKLNDGDILICHTVYDLIFAPNIYKDIDEIIGIYMSILNKNVELMFDRSPQCNSLFIKTLINVSSDFESVLRKCIINYNNQRDIESKYSKKHVVTANRNGNKIGLKKGTKLTTKKSVIMKEKILEHSKEFNGSMSDTELIEFLKIGRNTYYKYKKELMMEVKNYGRS